MHDNAQLTEARVRRQYRERVVAALEADAIPVDIDALVVPGEPEPFDAVRGGRFDPFEPGTMWGRPWGTTWFRLRGAVPAEWTDADSEFEVDVDLGFDKGNPGFQAEALVFAPDGTILKGLEPLNSWIPVQAGPGSAFEFYVEAASNPDVGGQWDYAPTTLGDPATSGDDPHYRFGHAVLRRRPRGLVALERDLATLIDVMSSLPTDSTRRAGILRALELATDALDPDDVEGTTSAARDELAPTLAVTASAATHRVVAVGHAHIDSAWLWPVRETVRKVARTFSNVLDLLDRYPDFVFVASSAQQYAWMRDHYPQLFERIRDRAREGRFVPVGGMWVESDTNMPGGEALARQLLAGKGFWMREFGIETTEVWLPDSFGYSAAMPQIVAASGSTDFLTQKTSWNETNVMPHHTFWWEGIDGTRVFTHFPPVDTYNSDLSGADLTRAERQHAERGHSDLSLVPFGFGDGGGGPTREMIETGLRKRDLDGSPRVDFGSASDFFAAARSELTDAATWSGEMYLEFHRGTYTSQARTKLGNRRSEHLLREAELWATTAAVRAGAPYPADALRSAWETTLLQQFHDILPGSSIAWVHQEAERNYARVAGELEQLIENAVGALVPDGRSAVFNAAPVAIDGVPALGGGDAERAARKVLAADSGWMLESEHLRVRVEDDGTVSSIVMLTGEHAGREAIAPGSRGNVLQFFRDTPNQWDAWDLDHHFNRTPIDGIADVTVTLEGETLVVERDLGSRSPCSHVSQRLSLSDDARALDIETRVQWTERQKLLKLAFDFDVHADTAASEIQFGHLRRPTHRNTSWDAARFETIAHRWLHVDEPGFGVTVANDRVYGHDVTRVSRPEGGTTTVVRESLLRAPTFPDPSADQGEHVFRHSVSIGGVREAVAEGYRLNLPLREAGAGPRAVIDPIVRVEGSPSLLVEAVKLAEDGSGDVIVRLYEARGGRAAGDLIAGFATTGAVRTDLLERPLPDQPEEVLHLDLRPFEIATVRIAVGR